MYIKFFSNSSIFKPIKSINGGTQIMFKKRKVFIALFVFALFLFIVFPYLLPFPENVYSSSTEIDISNISGGKFIDINGYTTFIIDKLGDGSDTQKVITFLHGFGGSSFFWAKNLDFFVESGYRVVALDLKGFGLSSKTLNQSYDHVSQASFVYDVLKYLGISKTHLVGHSMGANVALHFAYLFPDNINSLTLVTPAIIEEQNLFFNLLSKFLFLPPLTQYYRHLAQNYIGSFENFKNFLHSTILDINIEDSLVEQFYLPLQIKDWDLSLLGIVRDASKNQLPVNVFQKIADKKILLIAGSEDKVVPINKVLEINTQHQNILLKVINCAHLPMLEKPVEFNSVILDFLNNL